MQGLKGCLIFLLLFGPLPAQAAPVQAARSLTELASLHSGAGTKQEEIFLYDVMWDFVRDAGEYCFTAGALSHRNTSWEDVCSRMQATTSAGVSRDIIADWTELPYWRDICVGLLAEVSAFALSVKEKDPWSDKRHNACVMPNEYTVFLEDLPSWPRQSRNASLLQALVFYEEYKETVDNFQQVSNADIRAAYLGEFLITVVDELDIRGEHREILLADAARYLEFAARSPRQFYSSWARQSMQELDYSKGGDSRS